MFTIKIDEQRKLVHVEIAGILSVSETQRLNQELLTNAPSARRKFGSSRLLIDARLAPVQPSDTTNNYISLNELLQGDSDRMAVIVGSSLLKMQVSRIFGADRMRAFLSMNDAETWLLAHGSSDDSEHPSAT